MANSSKWDQFCDEINLLGLRYLKSDYGICFRVLSTIVLATFIGLTIYMISNRIVWYSENPSTVDIKESQLDTVQFPTIQICNNLKYMLSKTNASDVDSFHSDLIELFALLADSNKTVKSRALTILKKFPFIAQTLRELAKRVTNSKNITLKNCQENEICTPIDHVDESWYSGGTYESNILSDFNPQFANKPDDDIQYKRIKQQIGTILPKVYIYLHTYAEYKGFGRNNTDVILWTHSLDLMHYPNTRKKFLSWKRRLEAAADILESVAELNLLHFSKSTRQNEAEFIKSCKWKRGNTECTLERLEKEGEMCHQITSSDKHLGCKQESLSLILDLQQYDSIPESPSGTAKIYLRPSPKSAAETESEFSVEAGQHWTIAIRRILEVSRMPQNCEPVYLKYFDKYTEEKCMFETEINKTLTTCRCATSEIWDIISNIEKSFANRTPPCNIYEEFECQEKLYTINDSSKNTSKCNPDCYSIQYQADLTAGNLNMKELLRRLPPNFKQSTNISLWSYGRASNAIRPDLLPYRKELAELLHKSYRQVSLLKWLLDTWEDCTSKLSIKNLFGALNTTTESISMVECSKKERSDTGLNAVCFLLENRDEITADLIEWLQTITAGQMLVSSVPRYTLRLLTASVVSEVSAAQRYRDGTPERHNIQKFVEHAQLAHSKKIHETESGRHLSTTLLGFAELLGPESMTHFPAPVRGVPTEIVKKDVRKLAVCLNDTNKRIDKLKNLYKENQLLWSEYIKVIDDLMIYYPGKEYMLYVKKLMRIADVGGTLGLFLGATILLVYEVVVFLIKLLKQTLIMNITDNSSAAHEVHVSENCNGEKRRKRRWIWNKNSQQFSRNEAESKGTEMSFYEV